MILFLHFGIGFKDCVLIAWKPFGKTIYLSPEHKFFCWEARPRPNFPLAIFMRPAYSSLFHLFCSVVILVVVNGQSTTILPAPGQPTHQGNVGGFEIIGSSLVSAQQVSINWRSYTFDNNCSIHLLQIFLGTPDKVYFIDKVENNPTRINGHPAWASGMMRPNTVRRGGNVEYEFTEPRVDSRDKCPTTDGRNNEYVLCGEAFEACIVLISNVELGRKRTW